MPAMLKRNFFVSIEAIYYDQCSSPVGMEQKQFRGQRDLDYSTPGVQWLCTLLHRKAEAQGTRLSKPKKKGTRPIRNSRGIAV